MEHGEKTCDRYSIKWAYHLDRTLTRYPHTPRKLELQTVLSRPQHTSFYIREKGMASKRNAGKVTDSFTTIHQSSGKVVDVIGRWVWALLSNAKCCISGRAVVRLEAMQTWHTEGERLLGHSTVVPVIIWTSLVTSVGLPSFFVIIVNRNCFAFFFLVWNKPFKIDRQYCLLWNVSRSLQGWGLEQAMVPL